MNMKIGILITGHVPPELAPEHGHYGQIFPRLLEGHGFDYQSWNVVDGEFPGGVDDADGWLVTGSKFGAYEDHQWIRQLEGFVRDTYADGRPMIGVCFGHQVIAKALGGTVEKFGGGWSVGRVEYDINGERLALNAWHQDQVTVLPGGAKVIGSSPFCENAALVYGDKMWTIQPHPEFEAAFVDGLIQTRGKGVVPDAQLDAATATLDVPIDNKTIADQMAAFFKRGKP